MRLGRSLVRCVGGITENLGPCSNRISAPGLRCSVCVCSKRIIALSLMSTNERSSSSQEGEKEEEERCGCHVCVKQRWAEKEEEGGGRDRNSRFGKRYNRKSRGEIREEGGLVVDAGADQEEGF